MTTRILMGALLLAAPVFSQTIEFYLTETKGGIARAMGQPKASASISAGLESWQFEVEEMEEGEFSHYFVFEKKTGSLEAFARNYPTPRNVDALFAGHETIVLELAPGYYARARRMPEKGLLLAMGRRFAGEQVSQILLVREDLLRALYPDANLRPLDLLRVAGN